MFDINNILRDNIKVLTPYSSARDEFKGTAEIFLDANENSFGSPASATFNRYPDPLQRSLKEKISSIKGVPAHNIFLGNGSDEPIDLLYRAFCNPGKDNVIITPPTYGMYEVSANINDVFVKRAPLLPNFQLDIDLIGSLISPQTKLIWICSPNNPTGNSMHREDIELLLNNFNGIVVVDEAYINYSRSKSMIAELVEYPNLVVLQTLSKAWGLAGLRIGMAFASEDIIEILNRIKPPYNISEIAQREALLSLDNIEQVNNWIRTTVKEREMLTTNLKQLAFVKQVYTSDANFLLVKFEDPRKVYHYLVGKGIIVRDRSSVLLCDGCLRITVGTPDENIKLLKELSDYSLVKS
jgi:histidinol-phosphate aminotransferase